MFSWVIKLTGADSDLDEALAHLGFVTVRNAKDMTFGRYDFWSVNETSDWRSDYERGSIYAMAATKLIRDAAVQMTSIEQQESSGFGFLLLCAIDGICKRRKLGPVELGFLERLTLYASASIDKTGSGDLP